MIKSFNKVALNLGLSESTLRKYRQMGLLDDLVKTIQEGKVTKLNIDNKIIDRVKQIQLLQSKGMELNEILYKIVPISIYKVSIENGSGQHNIVKRIHFSLLLSNEYEPVFFEDKPQDISEEEMREIRSILIEMGDYKIAEKINFSPKSFTFHFEKFEDEIFDKSYLIKQKLLRTIQDKVKPLNWIDKIGEKIIFNELYADSQQQEKYNSCLKYAPTVKYSNVNKYAIRYSIGIDYIDTIQFKPQYNYLLERLKKIFKKQMKQINISTAKLEEKLDYRLTKITKKESTLLNIIREADYKKIEVIKKDGNKLIVKATKSQYNTKFKELINIYKKRDYNKITVTKTDGDTLFITEEDHYKL